MNLCYVGIRVLLCTTLTLVFSVGAFTPTVAGKIYPGRRVFKPVAVKCNNAERGCKAVGLLEEHAATCGFTLASYPKQL